jgi:hypothetical protein
MTDKIKTKVHNMIFKFEREKQDSLPGQVDIQTIMEQLNSISVGCRVSCKSREATGTVEKINGKSLLIRRDDKYVKREMYGDGEVRIEYDKWVGRIDNWVVIEVPGIG